MRYRKERAEVICRELLKLAEAQSEDIKSWKVKDGLYWSPEEADSAASAWRDFEMGCDVWRGYDQNSWFTAEITVPESFEGKPFSLIFDTKTEGWDAKNPQLLAFVNGAAVCGLDINHKDVLITDKAKAGDVYRVDLQGYTGTELGRDGKIELTARMAEVVTSVMRLYYDLTTPLKIIGRLPENDKTRLDLESAVEKTVNAVDLREPHSEVFYESVERALAIIKEEAYTKLAGCNDIIATCVGHTHIDVAWWWTVAQTRQKAARSFATVLKFMEEYPEYVFMSSQPQLYKFVKENQPALYERIKERIAEGRWEPEGGMWLEADCNLTSGESLVRQFLYGKRFFRDEFGINSRILWLPDVFGYSAALPQIMKLCGVDYFMTTKISWNQWNRLPFDTFQWRGIDGSEVFTHMITTTGAEDPMKVFITTYNGDLNANDLMGAWERYQQKEFNNDVLISYGYGDGGGGPTREMIENGLRLAHGVKGAPKVRFADSRQYFNELREKTKDTKLPRWVGELYFECHRGTLTSMARNKRSNRKCELLLQDLEFISVLAKEMPYPKTELDVLWEMLLLNQFHDILPGSSIKEVYDDTKRDYAELGERAGALLNERLRAVASGVKGSFAVINTLGFDRDDVITLSGDTGGADLIDGAGNVFACQKTHEGGCVAFVRGIPAKGVMGLDFCERKTAANPLGINGLCIETPFYSAEFDEKGFIVRLFHKESGREVLTGDMKGNELRVYEDRPMNWDNWDIDVYYTEKSWLVDETTRVEWLERGPVRATLLVERTFLQSVIKQKIHFYADIPRIDFETYADWKQSQLLLKARFQTDIKTPFATYDIQFGNVQRPTHFNTSWDEARFESCAHKWADISEGGYGVSILNDCKYGHAIHDGVIALTLIKSGIEPYPETDREEHWFTYSLLPHTGSRQLVGTVKSAHCLNAPAYAVKTDGAGSGDDFSFISSGSANVMIETVKKSETRETAVVRMYEYENTRTNAAVKLQRKAAKVYVVDCLENRLHLAAENTDSFVVELKPFEIKTLELVYE